MTAKKIRRKTKGMIESLSVYMTILAMLVNVSSPLLYASNYALAESGVEKETVVSEEDSRTEEKKEDEKEDAEEKVEEEVESVEKEIVKVAEEKESPAEPEQEKENASGTVPSAMDPSGQSGEQKESVGEIDEEAAFVDKADADTEKPEPDEPKKEIWSEDGKKATTNSPVEEGKEYEFPGNKDVVVKFTELPEKPGTLSIEEIKLSDEQVEELGALSDTAYDITSTMENGSFEYDLSLPKPKDEKNVVVKYAEKISELDEAKTVSNDDVTQKDDSVKVSDLDHFTVFIIAKHTGDVGSFGDWSYANCLESPVVTNI
jgi:hypothetical protein